MDNFRDLYRQALENVKAFDIFQGLSIHSEKIGHSVPVRSLV